MRLGIMPLGNNARNRLLPNIKGTGVEITAVYGRSIEKIRKECKTLGVQPYDDVNGFFNADFDAVYISSPNSLHYENAMSALRSGKHVLLEKPMTLMVQDARDLTDFAQKNDLILKIGFHLRFHPAVSEVKNLLQQDKIGDIVEVSGKWGGSYSSRVSDERRSWWENPAMVGGGSVMGTGVHVIDTVINLAGGLPEKVSGWRHPRDSVIDDIFQINMFYEDRIASAMSSRLMDVPDNTLRILGTEGYIEVVNFFSTEIDSELYLNGEVKQSYNKGNMYFGELKAFADSLRGADNNIASAVDGTNVVKIVNAAVSSSKENVVVKLSSN